MKQQLLIPCLFAAGLFMASCSEHIYVPNTVNAPLLKEKYEFKGSVSPTNYQAAFAVTNKMAIMVNGQYVYRFGVNDDNEGDLFVDRHTRGGVFEGAVGFFQPLDLKKRMVFDTYAGFGSGRFKTLDGAYNRDGSTGNANDYLLKARFSKFFVQPSIGFVHPVFEAAFSSRLSMVNFYGLHIGSNASSRQGDFGRIGDKTRAFIEPAFTLRVGYKYVKFQMQLLFSLPVDDDTYSGYDVNEYFQPVALGMGASINIGHWYDDFRKKDR